MTRAVRPTSTKPAKSSLADQRGTSLRVEDWHRFSADYDRTLLAWSRRFNAGWETISEQYGERFRRKWNYYLHGCAAAFRAGHIDVQQIVYVKGDRHERYQPKR